MKWMSENKEFSDSINNCILSKNTMQLFVKNTVVDIIPTFFNGKYLYGINKEGYTDKFEYVFRVRDISGFGILKKYK